MRVYHLNCATKRLYFPRWHVITRCLLIESQAGLILVDTGFGTRDHTNPTRIVRLFKSAMRVPNNLEETAIRQIIRLGFNPEDVRHIVLTHFHLDHAGGLPDFPWAKVHIFAAEYQAVMHPRGLMEQFYISAHWAHGPDWAIHSTGGDKWFGFDCVRVIENPQVLLIPLVGHSRGHCGVAVETPDGWLFHCGDTISSLYGASNLDLTGKSPSDLAVRWFVGPHLPRLWALVREHGDKVRVVYAHESFESFMAGDW